MQIRSSKNSCMGKENRLYSISLGVASLQGGLVGVATALSPATCRPFQVFSPSFFVGLGLVLDVGIHHKGWSIQRAFGFATETTGQLTLINVDRYLGRPGRSLAYKIRQLKISAIRSKTEKALGSKFDIRAFHDELLKDGPLPLDLLEGKMDAWIAREK